MDFERLNGDIKDMRRRNRGLALTVGVLAGGQLLAPVILNLLGSVRTCRCRSTRPLGHARQGQRRSIWNRWALSSPGYARCDTGVGGLEEGHPAWLRRAGAAGELKTRQELEAVRLKRINASTFFMPQQLVPSEDAQTVVVRGRLRTLVNGLETANDLKAYLVEFSYRGGRMHLKTFKEVPNAAK